MPEDSGTKKTMQLKVSVISVLVASECRFSNNQPPVVASLILLLSSRQSRKPTTTGGNQHQQQIERLK